MSGKFNMSDYVDVAERIREFHAKHPDGSLQSTLTRHDDGWLCRAEAYRSPEDPTPGVGHAFEPVPGKTPYTRDSEAMNAETSAWGRAIVALGFETKKIASAQEVQARRPSDNPRAAQERTAKKQIAESKSPFQAPKPRETGELASVEEQGRLVGIASRLKEAGAITDEQLDKAAGGKFDVAKLTSARARNLADRLERLEQNMAAA